MLSFFLSFGTGTARKCSPHRRHLRILTPTKRVVAFNPRVHINCGVYAELFSATDRCFPERYPMSQFKDFVSKTTIFSVGQVSAVTILFDGKHNSSPNF